MKEALDRAARQLGIEFVRYIFGDADGPIVSLGRGAMLALYFAPRSPMNDERFILQESVGPLSPGEYRAEKLLELWRREASPFKMPEDFLRLVVEAGRRTKPKSADVRLFKPLLIKCPEYFGDDLHQLLWRIRMAVAEQLRKDFSRLQSVFSAGRKTQQGMKRSSRSGSKLLRLQLGRQPVASFWCRA